MKLIHFIINDVYKINQVGLFLCKIIYRIVITMFILVLIEFVFWVIQSYNNVCFEKYYNKPE
jgi:hypothetical protein